MKALAALSLSVALIGPAVAQDDHPSQLLEDFVHYTRIAKPDLAAAYAESLLSSGMTNAELATLLDESDIGLTRFDDAMNRALLMPELESLAAELGQRLEHGRLERAREGDRIDEAISMLIGTQRAKLLARGRLEAAGEFAVPSLLRQIVEGQDEKLRIACQDMIRVIGRQAVTPLCTALLHVDPLNQRIICEILGDIGYPHAAPYLSELANDAGSDSAVRDAAARAFSAVGGSDIELSMLYCDLGHSYYHQVSSLTAYPYEDLNNVWSYDPFVGLTAMPVPTAIFNEIMAMQLASKAIELDASNRPALSLFVASNLKRENDLGDGQMDPVYGEAAYSPEFYATAYGTQVCMDVLALALDTKDTPLVRDAIAALNETTGGSNLFNANEGRHPLLEAVLYPDRRVQTEAGLTLALALPRQAFQGDHRVVPVLASAVRTGNEVFALAISDDDENRRQAMIRLESLDYTIAGAEADVASLSGAIAEAVGIDLIIIRMDDVDESKAMLADVRNLAKTAAAPVLIITSSVEVAEVRREYHTDALVQVARSGLDDSAFTAVVDELLMKATGGRITDAEAEIYAIEALSRLRDIAISNSNVYSLLDAESSLIDALASRTGGTKMMVADILAVIDSERSQRVLFDAALTAENAEQVDLLDRVAASVKRYGSRAERRHVLALLDLLMTSGGSTAEAAARVHGAMNLATPDAVKLITGTDEEG